MNKMSKKQEESLQYFLNNESNHLKILHNKYGVDFTSGITTTTLIELENILINKRETINDDDTIKALCFIIGETIINELGGNWVTCSVKRDPSYELPIIINWGRDNFDHVRLSPIEWIELFIEKDLRLGVFSKMILQNK